MDIGDAYGELMLAALEGPAVEIVEREDGFVVRGGGGLRGGRASSRGDHRLAMGLGVAGLASREGVEVEEMGASAVSYPGFLDDMGRVACW